MNELNFNEQNFRFSFPVRVRYGEVDAQGWVGNAQFLDYFTLARLEYLRALGLRIEGTRAPVQPVVRMAHVEYLAPIGFDAEIALLARVAHLGNTSCTFEYAVRGAEVKLLHAIGATVLVCIDMERLSPLPWPRQWRERIEAFEASGATEPPLEEPERELSPQERARLDAAREREERVARDAARAARGEE